MSPYTMYYFMLQEVTERDIAPLTRIQHYALGPNTAIFPYKLQYCLLVIESSHLASVLNGVIGGDNRMPTTYVSFKKVFDSLQCNALLITFYTGIRRTAGFWYLNPD